MAMHHTRGMEALEAPPVELVAGRALPAGTSDARPETARWLALSALLHAGAALAAFALLPAANRPLIERGGAGAAIDVLIIGESEATAADEGARSEPVMIGLPPTPPFPVPDLPEVPLPVEFAALESPPARPVPEVAKPALARKAQNRRKPMPARRTRPAKAEARGHEGQGVSAASTPAAARGGSGGAAATAGTAVMSSYRARVVAHLARHKTYPDQARDRGIAGRNAVTITLDRSGHVTASRLSGASGHGLLDAATLAALRRAQPFPAMPEGGPASLTLTIGLRYDLR